MGRWIPRDRSERAGRERNALCFGESHANERLFKDFRRIIAGRHGGRTKTPFASPTRAPNPCGSEDFAFLDHGPDAPPSPDSWPQQLKLAERAYESIAFYHSSSFEEMRQRQLVEVKGLTGQDYSFELTTAGRNVAAERSEMCKYAGPAPVSLDEYSQAIRAQKAKLKVNRAGLRAALADLVVSDSVTGPMGPALISQQSLFLYGPTGNGKTSYSERLLRVYQDSVIVPYAVEVNGQIITVYDPVVHRKIPGDPMGLDHDGLRVGGHASPRAVSLFQACSICGLMRLPGPISAPLQMKANNGVLIIDDFGRQAISPRELLNRWMLPLDRRLDYLSLSYGMKFEIPFELLLVFSTNLEPADLVDDAFLRRIPNKVYVGDVDDQTFDLIFEREVAQRNIARDTDTAEDFRKLCRLHSGGGLRACYPADICRILLWISEYEERPSRSAELNSIARLSCISRKAPIGPITRSDKRTAKNNRDSG